MFLSNRDLKYAIETERLIVKPEPKDENISESSIDLHLDSINEAKIWDIEKYQNDLKTHGKEHPELHLGTFQYKVFGQKYLTSPPKESEISDEKVFSRDTEIVIKPFGFLLWQTKEVVGTTQKTADHICFIDGKSTRARTGLLVHLTAPTIQAGWNGQITLEIANLGPFHFVLKEDDIIAQITVAKMSSIPDIHMKIESTIKSGQKNVLGN